MSALPVSVIIFLIYLEGPIMNKPNFFDDIQAKINQAIENSPAKDIEKNVKAMLGQGFSKLDLVTRVQRTPRADRPGAGKHPRQTRSA